MRTLILARKTSGKPVAVSILEHSTSGLNIDGNRIPLDGDVVTNHGRKPTKNGWDPRMSGGQKAERTRGQELGRYPTNVFLQGEDVVSELNKDSAARFFKKI